MLIFMHTNYTFQALTSSQISEINSTRTREEINTNISEENLALLKEFSRANEVDIILRPVNPTAFPLMKKGAVGKNMFVHGKSADKGLVDGLIPLKSSISKAGKNKDINKIQTFQRENNHSVEHSNQEFKKIENMLAKSAQKFQQSGETNITSELLLHDAGIAAEAFDQLISTVNLVDKNKNQIYIFTDNDGLAKNPADDPNGHIYAIKLQDGQFQRIDNNHEFIGEKFSEIQGTKPEEVKVIGKPEIKIETDGSIAITAVKPITADIDVLAYGAKLNLYGDVENHKTLLESEKDKIISSSGITLSEKTQNKLKRTNSIDYTSSKELMRLSSLEYLLSNSRGNDDSGFHDLLASLRESEVNLEHLKGMGEGVRPVLDITGAMRADFTNVEISHGSEQFNYTFPQPLDSEWVYINTKGETEIIQGEQELLNVFNQVKMSGNSMPPNPNWGWKLDSEGNFQIDKDLKEKNEFVDKLMMKPRTKEIEDILDARLQLGLFAINPNQQLSANESEEKLNELQNNLDEKIQSYKRENDLEPFVTYSEIYPQQKETFSRSPSDATEPSKIEKLLKKRNFYDKMKDIGKVMNSFFDKKSNDIDSFTSVVPSKSSPSKSKNSKNVTR